MALSPAQPNDSGIISKEMPEALDVERQILEAAQEVARRANKDYSPPPVHQLEAMMHGLKSFVQELNKKRIEFASKAACFIF
jgi:hypothetical protein